MKKEIDKRVKELICYDYLNTYMPIADIAEKYEVERYNVLDIVRAAGIHDINRKKYVMCNRLINNVEGNNELNQDSRIKSALGKMLALYEQFKRYGENWEKVNDAKLILAREVNRVNNRNYNRKDSKKSIIERHGVRYGAAVKGKNDDEINNDIQYYKSKLNIDNPIVKEYCEKMILALDNELNCILSEDDLNEGIIIRVEEEAKSMKWKNSNEKLRWINKEAKRRIDEFNAESSKQGWTCSDVAASKGATGYTGPVTYVAPSHHE